MELANLSISIDSRQVKTAKEWMDELTGSGARAEKAMDGVGEGGRKASAGTAAANASSRAATSAMTQQEAAARRLTATIRSYASVVVGAFGVREIIQMADQWGQYASRLKIATKESGDFTEVQNRMLEVSNRVYKSFANSAEMYIRTAKSLEQLGYSSKQAGDLVETLQYSLTVSAADSQKSASVIDALSKSILTGKVSMEEFNTVVAYNPRLQQAMADSITRGSLGALQKMVSDGKLTVTQLMKVTAQMEVLGKEADSMPVTMEDAMQRMNNKLTAFFGRVNESTGAVNVMTDSVDGLGDALDRIDISEIARDFAAIGTTWSLISDKAVEAWEAVDEFGKQFQKMLGASDDGVRSLGDSIAMSFEQSFLATAKELDMLYDVFFGTLASLGAGFATLWDNVVSGVQWAFDQAKYYAQSIVFEFQQAMVAAGMATSAGFKLPSVPESAPYLKSIREEADKARGAVEGTLGAYDTLVTSLGDGAMWRAQAEWMDEYAEGAGKSATAITKNAAATDKNTKKLSEAAKAAASFAKEREKELDGIYRNISAIQDQAQALEDEAATYGMGKAAIEEMEIARLNEQAAILAGVSGSEEQIELIQREVKERERLKSALTGKEFLDKQKKDWAEWERDIDQVFNRVGQSLTDSIFEGGKSAKELLKDVFKGLTFNVLINPMMGALQGSVTDSFGRLLGYQNPQQQGGAGGMMQNANSLNSIFGAGYQAMTGASAGASTASLGYANAVGAFGGDSIGALISANGGWEGAMAGFGSAAGGAAAAGTIAGISSLGAGLGASLGATIGTSTAAMATTTFAASVGGATAAAGGAAAGGAAMGGMGAAMGAIGTAMPYIGAAVAVASALGVFDSGPPKTRHSQRNTAELANGSFGITQRDDRQGAGAAEAAQAMAEASVKAANEIFSKVGVNAAIDSFYAIMESSILGDRNGVASGGTLRSADTTSNIGIPQTSDMTVIGFGGWSEEEMLPRLAADIQLSVLQAFQQKAGELPKVMAEMLNGVDIRGLGAEEAAALIARFYGVVTEVESFRTALTTLPFESLKALSFDAAAGLIAAAGGLENLTTGLSSYYQNFYSQEEQLALSAKGIETALSGVSLAMPDVTQGATAAKDAFRSLFESLDPATESGAAAIAVMLGVNESFAQLATGMEQLSGVASQTAAAIAQQRLGLENQLLQLQGNTIELRKRELAAIDVSNHALQESVWAYQDQAEAAQLAAAAQAEAAQLAAGIASERLGLENQLLQLEGNTAELRRRELAALDGSNRGLQEHIWALQDQAAATQAAAQTLQTAYQTVVQAGQAEIAGLQKSFGATDSAMSSYRSAVQRLSSEFSGLISTIGQGVADLRGQAEEAARMQYDQARAVIGTALVTRQMPQTADLSEALRIAQQGVTGQVYGSSFEQQKAYLVLANEMEALKGIAQPELDTAQATLAQLENQYALLRGTNGIAGDSLVALEEQLRAALSTEESARTQIAGIESQLELSRLQFEELTGIKSSIDGGFSSLAAALASFASAAVGSVASGAVSSGGDYYTAKLAQLQATGSMHGGIDWTKATTSDLSNYFASIGLTPQEHWDQWGKNEDLKLPGFDVGTARVTHDMNARIHKDEIIIDPRSSDILRRYGIGVQGGGDNETKELLRQIVDRLDRLEGPASRSARSNERLTEMIDQVTEGGNAIRNVNMETVDVRIKA